MNSYCARARGRACGYIRDGREKVLEKLRMAVDARNEGTRVERLRKLRDQKVVLGLKIKEDMTRVTERLRRAGNLVVKEVKNKDPLIIISTSSTATRMQSYCSPCSDKTLTWLGTNLQGI